MYFNIIFFFINILSNSLISAISDQTFDNLVGYKDFTYCGYSKKYAHLSFDDGPIINLNGADTLKILEVLDELKIKASFFLVGKNINMYPYTAQEVVKRGHTVGSHSWSHRDITNRTNINLEDSINEFIQSSKLFENILGIKPKYYRPPYGNINAELMNLITTQTGMNLVMWNVDSNDWRIVQGNDPKNWVNDQLTYLQKVMISSKNFKHSPSSMILLAHDIRSTQDMIRNIVKYIKSLGYIFVDLDTCYNNWLIDKKPESPCINDFDTITNGVINVLTDCTQLASGLPLSCVPDGNQCLLNKCGSPGCGFSCDNRNICKKGCTPSCVNRTCGDDGCGNSCGMCGTDCINGICQIPILPDLSKMNLCRPHTSGSLEIYPVKDQLILLNYEITAQWDTGMVIIYTLSNNYQPIDQFRIKIYNAESTKFENVYGAIMVDKSQDESWYELSLEYVGFQESAKFTIEFQVNTNNPMKMCCTPISFEISCLNIDNMCLEYKNTLPSANDSFKVMIINVFFTSILIFFIGFL